MAGTEAFPDLGRHCQLPDCNQLDFLPFKCAGCEKVFCVEHRSYKSHECSNSDHNSRKVVVCDTCSMSIEIPRNRKGVVEEEDVQNKLILEKHRRSGDCDPKKKKKPTCGVRRCKEILTFSNTSTCKSCEVISAKAKTSRRWLLVAVHGPSRMGEACTKKTSGSGSSTASTPSTSVKAY
ncbi:hypothetical protein LXL04_006186 [Taraxacum kok-saghyz]